MPLYMDVHNLGGAVTLEDAGKAHQADSQTQRSYEASYLRYSLEVGQQAGYSISADSAGLICIADPHLEERNTRHG